MWTFIGASMMECEEVRERTITQLLHKRECTTLCVAGGDTALAASAYDRAIQLCSIVIVLDSKSDIICVNAAKRSWGRCCGRKHLKMHRRYY